jgi:hypothetical protein
MRAAARAAIAGILALAGACNRSPTTITVRVDVPTGPPITAAFLGVTLTPLGDGGARFLYDISSHPTLDSGGRTLVVIMPDAYERTLEVTVDALAATGDDDGGPAPVPLRSGEASVMTVSYRNVDVSVHLSVSPCSQPDAGCDGGAADADADVGAAADVSDL